MVQYLHGTDKTKRSKEDKQQDKAYIIYTELVPAGIFATGLDFAPEKWQREMRKDIIRSKNRIAGMGIVVA